MNTILYRSTADFLNWRQSLAAHQSLGLVPTMGNLHAGHLSIVDKAMSEHAITVVTIFVNPKQFGPNEDFARYPRTLEADLEQLEQLHARHGGRQLIVFAPADTQEIYPPHFSTTISVSGLTAPLCSQHRPGHFDGVTTVVYQLFALIRPTQSYFGLKDYQQFKVIERMTQDLRLPITVTPHPIIRDHDGLALSSRNQYLSSEERQLALHLPHSIATLQELLRQRAPLNDILARRDLVTANSSFGQWQYLEILDAATLQSPGATTKQFLVAGALKIGHTRLIDNALVEL